MTINEEPVIKVEADRFLNLPNEIIIVDDDLDIMEVEYLPRLLERFDNISLCHQRLALLRLAPVPTETVNLVSSESETENTETVTVTHKL